MPSVVHRFLVIFAFFFTMVPCREFQQCLAAPERICGDCGSIAITRGLADAQGLWDKFFCTLCGSGHADSIKLNRRCTDCKIMGIFGLQSIGYSAGALHCM
jgi:hypothetical protein